jgi:hypothetical protein
LIQLFKNNHAQAILATLAFLAGMALLVFQVSAESAEHIMYPAGQWLKKAKDAFFYGKNHGEALVSSCLIIVQALYFGYIMCRHDILHKNTYLPAVFFGLFNMLFPEQLKLTSQLAGNGFMVLAIGNIFSIQGKEKALPGIMNAGMFMGLAVLFIPQMLVFIPLFLVALFLFKPLRSVDFFQFLTGVLLPVYLLGMLLFFLGYEVDTAAYFKQNIFDTHFDVLTGDNSFILFFLGFLALILLMVFVRLQQNFYKNTVKMRKYQQFMLAYFFFSVLSLIFSPQPFQQNFTFVAAPLGVFLSYYFLSGKKRWAKEAVFLLLLLGGVICNQLNIF